MRAKLSGVNPEWRARAALAIGSPGFLRCLNPREHATNNLLNSCASKFMFPNANDAPSSGLERSHLS
jgi:hypothetical protein